MNPNGGGMATVLIPMVIAVAVILLRNSRPRKLRIERLWIYPVVLFVLLVATLSAAPPPVTPVSIGLLVLGLVAGAAIGWWRGKLTNIIIDPETHEMTASASAIGIALILVVFLVRFGMRDLVTQNAAQLHLPVVAAIDSIVVLGIGMMSVQRLEMWLRARAMLAEAIAAKAGR